MSNLSVTLRSAFLSTHAARSLSYFSRNKYPREYLRLNRFFSHKPLEDPRKTYPILFETMPLLKGLCMPATSNGFY